MAWKALYVNSRAEKKVSELLKEKNIIAYVPLKKEKRKWSDRYKIVLLPLINGYVFVNVDKKNRDTVFEVQGVIQYVRYNGADAIIKDWEIEILKSIEEKGYHVDIKFGIDFKAGDEIKIKEGSFKGYEGLVVSTQKADIVKIAIKSIGFQLIINLPKEIIAK
ncbi:MAG: UpxY family transcription antiterminator [Bacteroidetes bacterium]|nr:UpxY family transcription antiterminator [Bacteroidota bacterium]